MHHSSWLDTHVCVDSINVTFKYSININDLDLPTNLNENDLYLDCSLCIIYPYSINSKIIQRNEMNLFNRALLFSALVSTSLFAHAATSNEQLQDEIKILKKQYKTIMERMDATLDTIESNQSEQGHGSKGKTSIGGYGELHYNNLGGSGGAIGKKEIDFHRFVMFLGHEFSDKIRFFSELELEHSIAGEGKAGEIELEQGYLEFDLSETLRAKGGLFLIPVGIINETHEPNFFYGVERNPVEKNIVPATWWEAGAALDGEITEGVSYDIAFTSGLDLSSNDKVRDGRQKVANARANSPMITGRLKYTGVPGLELATTLANIDDYTQGQGTKNSATMIEAHAVYKSGAFGVRALFATWTVTGKAAGFNKQLGWYVEPSLKVSDKVGLFARYNEYDNQAGDSGPGNSQKQQTDVGVNFWPHEDVVIKADYQVQSNANNKDLNGFNIGIGYQF